MKSITTRTLVLLATLLAAIVSPQAEEQPERPASAVEVADNDLPTPAELAERFRESVNAAEKIQIKMTEDVTYYDMELEDGQIGERDAFVASRQALAVGEKATHISVRIVSLISSTPRSLESKVYRPDISDEPVSIIRIKADEDTGRPVGSFENFQNSDETTRPVSFYLSDFYDGEWIDQAENVLSNPALAGLPAVCATNAEAWVIWQNGEADSIAEVIAEGQVVGSVNSNGRKLYKVYCLLDDDVTEDEDGNIDTFLSTNTYFLDAETGLMVRKENFRVHNRKGKFQSGLLTTRTYEWDISE